MSKKKQKVAVGLSGGVDSSVAAAILLEKGYEVVGITMIKYDGQGFKREPSKQSCYGPGEKKNIRAAASICKDLNIKFYSIDLRTEFREHVIEYFRKNYLEGRTPNPCVVCNAKIKFGFLIDKATELGIEFDFFATGHYARIDTKKERYLLKRGKFRNKDQSYFLYSLSQPQLARTLFPLGEYNKQIVREMAQTFGLNTYDKAESQDFIANGSYSHLFMENESREGEIVDRQGRVLGRHNGIIYYTIGQRKGLGIASSGPLYVNELDASNDKVIVGSREELFSKGLVARDINLIALDRLKGSYRAKVKIRYRHKETDAVITKYGENRVKVLFDEPQLSVTPGQSVVFYSGDIILGGGVIERSIN